VIPGTLEVKAGEFQFEISLGKAGTRPYLKNKLKGKGIGNVAQVVESLTSKFKA
jgi:hypothetical protein